MMLTQRLPWHTHHRRLPTPYVLKIVLTIASFATVLAIIHSFAVPLDTLASKAKEMGWNRPEIKDNTLPWGENKVWVHRMEFLGIQMSNNSCARRDLGFTGKLGEHWYAIHGDALWCPPGVTDPELGVEPGDEKFTGMVRNTLSLMTEDVLRPIDLYVDDTKPVPRPRQFFTFNEEWGEHQLTGFGGTSICAVDDKTGVVYYAINQPGKGVVGAGVAKVELVEGANNLTVSERMGEKGIWWTADKNPRYGDVSAYRDTRSDYIYLLGGAPNSKDYLTMALVYQARVPYRDAFDLSKYEYWHGRFGGWKSERLTTFNKETAVMWNVGQGQLMWNEHLQCYMFVHTNPGSNQVVIRTSHSPEGPWSDDMVVYTTKVSKKGGQIYSAVTHEYLDPTGKTLTITYTNHPNSIECIKITFS